MKDYIEFQQKILNVSKLTKDEDYLKTAKTKCIARIQYINYYGNNKAAEIIAEKDKSMTREKTVESIYAYIDSCNDNSFLLELVKELTKTLKKLGIYYRYDGPYFDEEEEEAGKTYYER